MPQSYKRSDSRNRNSCRFMGFAWEKYMKSFARKVNYFPGFQPQLFEWNDLQSALNSSMTSNTHDVIESAIASFWLKWFNQFPFTRIHLLVSVLQIRHHNAVILCYHHWLGYLEKFYLELMMEIDSKISWFTFLLWNYWKRPLKN